MKKVLLVVAHEGFRDTEYLWPKEELEKAGIAVEVASDKVGTATAADNRLAIEVSKAIGAVSAEDYDGVFLIGGPGALAYLDNVVTYKLMKEAAKKCRVWGAICISPRILARAGLVNNKKVTGWNNDGELEGILVNAGAKYVPENVVVDGKLITADGPKSARQFGKKIAELL